MKTFNEVCKGIDWLSMEKARVTIKNLEKTKPQLKYLSKFLDEIADSAVDAHGVKMSEVYPSLVKARLINSSKKHERNN
jgi:hypothetical protein